MPIWRPQQQPQQLKPKVPITAGWTNISHDKGIATSAISHKKGIAVASISHVKGVAV